MLILCPELFLHKIQNLGRVHMGYGVQPHHYDLVGEALLYALSRCLGKDFTFEVKAAWIAAYALLTRAMRTAVNETI